MALLDCSTLSLRRHHNYEMNMKRLLGKVSEEARVSLLVLVVQGAAIWTGRDGVALRMLLFAALGGYLTLRLLRAIGLPKE